LSIIWATPLTPGFGGSNFKQQIRGRKTAGTYTAALWLYAPQPSKHVPASKVCTYTEDGGSKMTKTFSHEEGGLSYIVTVSEANGEVFAEVKVVGGSMDVNAIYVADDDFSGKSVNLKGPLNMSGGGSRFEGQSIQWDSAIKLSSPGLGREGKNKETFLTEGDVLKVKLDATALDQIDFIGIRATSTSTEGKNQGSIKAVMGHPEEHEDP
jgi:hypothetical protein